MAFRRFDFVSCRDVRMSYKALLLLCIASHLFSADRPDDVILTFHDGSVKLSCDELKTFPVIKSNEGSGDCIPISIGSVSTMISILTRDFEQRTTRQLVSMVDLLDHLIAPKGEIDDLVLKIHDQFKNQTNDIAELFDGQGEWTNLLKQKYLPLLSFIAPCNKLDNFEKIKTFDIAKGFRLKGCSRLGTYALLAQRINYTTQRFEVMDTRSGKKIHDFQEKSSTVSFSDFNDSLILVNGGKTSIKVINCEDTDAIGTIGSTDTIHSLALAPDSNTIAVGILNRIDLIDRSVKQVKNSADVGGRVIFLKFSHDGNSLIVVKKTKEKDSEFLMLRNAHSLEPLWNDGGFKVPQFKSLAVSPDNRELRCVTKLGKISRINLQTDTMTIVRSLGESWKLKRVFYVNGIPVVSAKAFGFSGCYFLPAGNFSGELLGFEKACFASTGRLLRNYCWRNDKDALSIGVYDIHPKIQPSTLKALPLSLFHILKMDPQNLVDPQVVDQHVRALEAIRAGTNRTDSKIIDGLLERFGKKTSCSIS